MQMPKQHPLVRHLDALYAERDDALDDGDLDRVHQLQAAIMETAQQVLAATSRDACSRSDLPLKASSAKPGRT
jgi:hypothetical protein